MLVNQGNLNTLFTGFKGSFNKGFAGALSAYKSIAMVVPSTTREEEYGWLGQTPRMREWIGDRVVKSLAAHGYKIKNRDFEQTIEVDRNDIEDDQYGVLSPLFVEMGRAAAELPDELIFSLLKAGFSTNCYDGQYYFDTDHQVLDVNKQPISVSNTQGGSGAPWFLLDCSRGMKPMVFQERKELGMLIPRHNENDENVFWRKSYVYGTDGRVNAGFGLWQLAYGSKQPLTPENYELARAAMMNMVGDEGRPLGIKPDTLVCGPSHEGAAMRLLNNGTRVILQNDGNGIAQPVPIQNEWAGTAKPIITQWAA